MLCPTHSLYCTSQTRNPNVIAQVVEITSTWFYDGHILTLQGCKFIEFPYWSRFHFTQDVSSCPQESSGKKVLAVLNHVLCAISQEDAGT
jgi:hypothetical protein